MVESQKYEVKEARHKRLHVVWKYHLYDSLQWKRQTYGESLSLKPRAGEGVLIAESRGELFWLMELFYSLVVVMFA